MYIDCFSKTVGLLHVQIVHLQFSAYVLLDFDNTCVEDCGTDNGPRPSSNRTDDIIEITNNTRGNKREYRHDECSQMIFKVTGLQRVSWTEDAFNNGRPSTQHST
jgi:hypothetical protein